MFSRHDVLPNGILPALCGNTDKNLSPDGDKRHFMHSATPVIARSLGLSEKIMMQIKKCFVSSVDTLLTCEIASRMIIISKTGW
ncbi:hypothetical protein ACTVMJ_22625, partial [Serratia marcescens]